MILDNPFSEPDAHGCRKCGRMMGHSIYWRNNGLCGECNARSEVYGKHKRKPKMKKGSEQEKAYLEGRY